MSGRARLGTRLRPRTTPTTWTPTAVLVQAAFLAMVSCLIAVGARRLDLLVLAAPGLGLLWWAAVSRPQHTPHVEVEVSATVVTERVPVEWLIVARAEPGDHVESLAVQLATADGVRIGPPGRGFVLPIAQDGTAGATVTMTTRRWGRHEVGAGTYAFSSSWGLFRHGPGTIRPVTVQALPQHSGAGGQVPVSHPIGLVGANRSRSRGEGSEFDDIRPFRPGDRLRQIHWPVSARTGELHARTTYAEQDAEVWLLIDVAMDVGGAPDSSLDLQVRSAAALAWRLLNQGERVGVATFLTDEPVHLAPAAGRTQYRRILGVLAGVHTSARVATATDSLRHVRRSAGAWMVLFTPLLAPAAADRAAHLAARGHPVLVMDSMPGTPRIPAGSDPQMQLAWRLRMLERQVEVDRLRRRGVPVARADDETALGGALQALSRRPRAKLVRR